MKKTFLVAAAAAFLASSAGTAFAEQAAGVITNIDSAAGTVTLADGRTYRLPALFNAAALTVGDTLAIEFSSDAIGLLTATAFPALVVGDRRIPQSIWPAAPSVDQWTLAFRASEVTFEQERIGRAGVVRAYETDSAI